MYPSYKTAMTEQETPQESIKSEIFTKENLKKVFNFSLVATAGAILWYKGEEIYNHVNLLYLQHWQDRFDTLEPFLGFVDTFKSGLAIIAGVAIGVGLAYKNLLIDDASVIPFVRNHEHKFLMCKQKVFDEKGDVVRTFYYMPQKSFTGKDLKSKEKKETARVEAIAAVLGLRPETDFLVRAQGELLVEKFPQPEGNDKGRGLKLPFISRALRRVGTWQILRERTYDYALVLYEKGDPLLKQNLAAKYDRDTKWLHPVDILELINKHERGEEGGWKITSPVKRAAIVQQLNFYADLFGDREEVEARIKAEKESDS